MEFRAKFKVGDTVSRLSKEKKCSDSEFPWRPILLCVLRLVLCAWCLSQSSSQMVIRTDGSTSTKRPFTRSRAHYRYDEMNVMLAVVLLDMFVDRCSSVLAGVSSVLLLAAVLADLTSNTHEVLAQRDRFTDGEVHGGSGRAFWSSCIASLAMFALYLVTLDLVESVPMALLNSQLIFTNVGLLEASSYLVIFSTSQAFQFFLLCGGFNFQNSLFRDDVDSRPNKPGLKVSRIT